MIRRVLSSVVGLLCTRVIRAQVEVCPVEDVTLGLATANFADPSSTQVEEFYVDDL